MVKVLQVSNKQQRDVLFEVRKQVFVVEQKVSEEEEYDEFEDSSVHFGAYFNDKIVGTARKRETYFGTKLERFAVLKEYRKMGVGAALVKSVLESCSTRQTIYLHAQIQVVDFYAKYGFVKKGEMFEEAGIKHYKMILT